MLQFFSARHGSYDSNRRLSSAGEIQIEKLADSIHEIINGNSVYLISSSAPRAVDTAEIFAKRFGITQFATDPYLWSANDASSRDSYEFSRDRQRLYGIVENINGNADNIIVVSHLGAAEDLAAQCMKRNNVEGQIKQLSYGGCIHIDLVKRRFQFLPQ